MNYKSLALGVAIGYAMREGIGQVLKSFEKPKADAAVSTDKNGIHLSGLHMNPRHMGAVHLNPHCMSGIHMNPRHMGAIQMGALHTNPHSAFARSQEGAHAAKAPWGYGAIHLG